MKCRYAELDSQPEQRSDRMLSPGECIQARWKSRYGPAWIDVCCRLIYEPRRATLSGRTERACTTQRRSYPIYIQGAVKQAKCNQLRRRVVANRSHWQQK